jgi:hypothetical protein
MSELTNLYNEILDLIGNEKQIDFILIGDMKVPIEWFLNQAKRINYDCSYGNSLINTDIKIVLKNGTWLERCEYDGSEWFELREKPNFNREEKEPLDLDLLLDVGHDVSYGVEKDDLRIDGIPLVLDKIKKKGYRYFWIEENGIIIPKKEKCNTTNV